MKKILLLTCLILFGSLFACSEPEREPLGDDLDLTTYLETIELPDNFSIDFDSTKIKPLDVAKTYKAKFIEFDKDKLIEELIRGEIVSTKTYAQGPWFEALSDKVKEYLIVYDGGKSFGTNSSLEGGFTYSFVVDYLDKLSHVITFSSGPPDMATQISDYRLKSNYPSFEDLSFMTYEDALNEVKKILNFVNFPEFEVSESYSLDLDTMTKNYQLYLEKNNNSKDDYSFSKNDECYLFVLRQTIDNIPLANVNWQQGTRGTGEATETEITLFYSKEGLISISARGIYEIIEKGEDKKLISGANALNTVIDNYSNAILKNPTRIISMELNYVGTVSNNNYQLIPAWVFCIAEQKENDELKVYDSHSYYVINAITGERMLNAR